MDESKAGRSERESHPEIASLFPLSLISLKDTLTKLNYDPESILRLITNARTQGAPDELFVNVVHHDSHRLERWHTEKGDFLMMEWLIIDSGYSTA